MPAASAILDQHVTLRYRSLDRLLLNLYVPQLQRPMQVVAFLKTPETPIASPALFGRRSDRFARELRAYAERVGAPWIHFERGEDKEARMRPLMREAERSGRSRLVAVGVAQERVFGWGSTKSVPARGSVDITFVRRSQYVNQYYLYLWDREWGPAFIKISAYAPWGGRVYLNGHEWLKRQLALRGIGFTALDNGLLACERPAVLEALSRALGAPAVRRFFARWMKELPQPLTAADRARGFGYALSLKQVEVSDTAVFDRPVRGRQWFEATITEHLALGRPHLIALLFGRRVSKQTPGRFETRVMDDHTIPEILFRYKRCSVKQYLKQGRALRTETTVNDTYDLGIGRALEHLTEVRERGGQINARLLAMEAGSEDARLSGPELSDLVLPWRSASGRRIPALRFGDPRVMALLAAVMACVHLPAGFHHAHLRRSVAALLGLAPEAYSRAAMTYDLARLVGHELIARESGTYRYRVTARGLAISALLTKLADRVLDPAFARIDRTAARSPTDPWRRFEGALDALLERAHIAA
ncbi:MAG: hypothetical protein HY553_01095 [Elusimicrobia bacterium]|nr:hypothetical protein [Elusimicrobiota bacterium]